MLAKLTQLRLPVASVTSQSGESTGADDEIKQVSGALQSSASTRVDGQPSVDHNCCIGCFRLMPLPPESPPEGQLSEGGNQRPSEPELLCVSCIAVMAGKNSNAAPASSVLSPLPKLSLLVKAEAKCQDQLQMLRSQQELLRQQRESIQATKRAKEESVAAERELARQRRKHFLMIQERRKREEELKFQQFQTDEQTSRSEQEAAAADKPRKKKPKPKVDISRKSEPSSEESSVALPQVVDSTPPRSETPHLRASNTNANTAEAHSSRLWERRRQMLTCYSQDLSPLVHGRKPKRLPFPKPVAAIVTSTIVKRRQTTDNNAQLTTTAKSKGQQHNSRKLGKNAALKATKLRPLDDQSLKRQLKGKPHTQFESNQFEEIYASRSVASPLSLQPPRHAISHAAPLTAEIKPVSWAYELAKDVLPHADDGDYINEASRLSLSTSLHTVAEEETPQFTMFPLQHQLPSTIPPAKPHPEAETFTKVPRWEYSAERLSSLLEKYNVSVSAVTSGAGSPPKP